VVEFGESAVDTSVMTGESVPAEAAGGGAVIAGTVVVSGRLIIRAAKTGQDTAPHPRPGFSRGCDYPQGNSG
jgi:cation transport ATPase